MTKRKECATVLAALRVFQAITNIRSGTAEYTADDLREMEHFEDGTRPLNAKQIDALAKRINLQPADAPAPTIVIAVQGGVATCQSKPRGVVVVIDDQDANEVSDEQANNPFTYGVDDEGDGQ